MVNVHQDRRLERYKNKDLDGANVYGERDVYTSGHGLSMCTK